MRVCDTDGVMAPQKKMTPKKSTNGGRATVRDVLKVVTDTNKRIDGTNKRIDESLAGQQRLSEQMTELHDSMHDLRKVTNERLHTMEADITSIKRPLTLLANGWTKAVALGSATAAVSGILVKMEVWRFLPF